MGTGSGVIGGEWMIVRGVGRGGLGEGDGDLEFGVGGSSTVMGVLWGLVPRSIRITSVGSLGEDLGVLQ